MTAPRRPPTVAEAFFRQGFGCLGAVVFKIALVVVVVLVVDCRHDRREKRDAAQRAEASALGDRLADGLAAETDEDGRFVRRPEGPLPDADPWGRPFRLAYHAGPLTDRLEVRSAGPDGEWDTRDDVAVTRSASVSTRATTREAAKGLLDGAKKALGGGKRDGTTK